MLLVLCGVLTACVAGIAGTGARKYPGELEFYLQPVDEQGVCAVTVGVRNLSGERQGEAHLRLDWFQGRKVILRDQFSRLDPVDVGRYDAKNIEVPSKCSAIERVRIRSAVWRLGWDITEDKWVPIDTVDGAEVRFRWDESIGYFVGRTVSAADEVPAQR